MKVYISADMEGVTGVSNWDEVSKGHGDYDRFRRQMTREVVAACEGAIAAGAESIVVKDAHATGRNLDGRDLPPRCQLVSGWSGHPLSMVQEIDKSFTAALFVGYHARAGATGNPLAHTMSSSRVAEMRLNGSPVSEYVLHAHAAGLFGVPVVFVSGDEALCAEVSVVSPTATTVATMRGSGPSVITEHPSRAAKAIRTSSEAALRGDLASCLLERSGSYRLEVTYKRPFDAYGASFYPGAERVGPAAVAIESEEYLDIMCMIKFCV
jgi:D-amino peptidase